MESYDFKECLNQLGINSLSPDLELFYQKWQQWPDTRHSFIRRSFITEMADEYKLPKAQENRLYEAVDEIEKNDMLLFFSNFLTNDMCHARHRCDLDDYRSMEPKKAMKNWDLYSFLVLMACIEPSKERLANKGIPEEYYKNIPHVPLSKQMKKLGETGNGCVEDFPWDMNFYTHSIFLLDRFYFIPFRFYEDMVVYQRKDQKKTIAFFTKPVSIRRDGQINGVNGQTDCRPFLTQYEEKEGYISGTPILPKGIVKNQCVTLEADQWNRVLEKGDILLGTHIPGGPGYCPERLLNSVSMAADFYQTYFNEIPIKGFGSESWLYDPHLRLLLPPESNICRMQDQMYLYPIESGDGQMWNELYGSTQTPPKKLNTRLEKKAWSFMQKGGRFTPAGMFILLGDIHKINTGGIYG